VGTSLAVYGEILMAADTELSGEQLAERLSALPGRG